MKHPARLTPALLTVILAATRATAQQADSVAADSIPLYKLEGISVSISRSATEVQRVPFAVGVPGAADLQGLEATVTTRPSSSTPRPVAPTSRRRGGTFTQDSVCVPGEQ